VESWIEVNLVTAKPVEEALLAGPVDDLVHGELRDEIATWCYFWEPELRLRIRWRDPGRAEANRQALDATLDSWRANGTIRDWYEGAHGARGETYVGEAEHYGDEVWPRIQLDWMNGSELALRLIKLDRDGRLTRNRDYHWQRHVHLFTNQLRATWDAEIDLCLRQAIGYLRLGGPTANSARLVAELRSLHEG
jgi:hypothetical protein